MPHIAKVKPVKPVAMLATVHEIGIYVHRFHNLDLFKQGWYQIKITLRWENNEDISLGLPAKVLQYEAPDMGPRPSGISGIWRIDDTDNSFSTPPFHVKYSRQDIHLCLMILFRLSRTRSEGLTTAAAILKFELKYALKFENSADFHASPVAVHEFRIPPKALFGLHSYCPVHFDNSNAVLVDVSVHVSIQKDASYSSASKVPSNSANTEVIVDKRHGTVKKGMSGVASVDVKNVMLIKALLTARDLLIEELQKFSKAVDQAIDISEFVSTYNNMEFLNSMLQANQFGIDVELSGQGKKDALSILNTGKVFSLSQNELLDYFHALGDQLSYLWNMFLMFQRDNKTKILEFLRDAWVQDRKAEWSIWMLYSKVEMPHHYINSGSDNSSYCTVHKKVHSLKKLHEEPFQILAKRVELHRKSISQMRINNRSIQDMHIYGDPSRIPIVMVDHVINATRGTTSQNPVQRHIGLVDSHSLNIRPSPETIGKKSAMQSNARVLKLVVFVHGFQGHHLDLRLVRNQWLLIDPKAEVLMSKVNEDKTFGDFREMGQRLAQEVISFLKKKMDKASRYGNLRDIRLSFVGHSVGNLIIRSAIADSLMEPFLRHLHTYISVSGPHLGYLYSSNSLFNSGLWLLKKLKDTQCLHQLTLTDDPAIENTFIYKLCKKKTFQHFRNIILLSSPQDGYVPYHSARIESCPAASLDFSKKGRLFLQMLNDCLDQIRSNPSEHRVFMRCDVNFYTSAYAKNFNSLIGRAAHIDFLDSDIFAKFIMWSFPDLFR